MFFRNKTSLVFLPSTPPASIDSVVVIENISTHVFSICFNLIRADDIAKDDDCCENAKGLRTFVVNVNVNDNDTTNLEDEKPSIYL